MNESNTEQWYKVSVDITKKGQRPTNVCPVTGLSDSDNRIGLKGFLFWIRRIFTK